VYGDNAELKTPWAVRSMLREYGGLTPHGWPMWRLVRAGDCTILCQGTMHQWPRKGRASRPERITAGRMLQPRYRDIPRESWILQKWFPPKLWGTAAQWKEHRAEDIDTALFVQEFPVNGDYFMMAGPWATIEEAGDLRVAIHLYLMREAKKPRDAENYIRLLMSIEYSEREKRLLEAAREIDRAETELQATLKSVSGDAQRVRDRIAAQAGLEGHLGASEAWG